MQLVLFLIITVFSCVSANVEVFTSTNNAWFIGDSDATLSCSWAYTNPDSATEPSIEMQWDVVEDGGKSTAVARISNDGTNIEMNPGSTLYGRVAWKTDFPAESGYLTIMNFTISDKGSYKCTLTIGAEDGSTVVKANAYYVPKVTVIDIQTSIDLRPKPDEEEMETTLPSNSTTTTTTTSPLSTEASDGKVTIAQCNSVGAYPKPTKYVFHTSEGVELQVVTVESSSIEHTNGTFTSTAELRIVPTPELDGQRISCTVHLESGVAEESSNVPVEMTVLYPTTEVEIKFLPQEVMKGEKIEIQCVGNGNPPPTFSLEPAGVAVANGNTFKIENVQIEDSTHEYTCLGNNGFEDVRSQPGMFVVHYMEKPMLEPRDSITLTKGEMLKLACSVQGNPTPVISWYKDNVDQNSDFTTFRKNNVEYSDAGTYECVAKAPNSEFETRESIVVNVQGACEATFKEPVVSSSSEKPFTYRLKLSCEVTGSPDCKASIVPQNNFKAAGVAGKDDSLITLRYDSLPKFPEPVAFFCLGYNGIGKKANVSQLIDEKICCDTPAAGGLSTGAVVGIILLVLVILIGIPVACYFVKKRNAQPTKKKTPADPEAAASEKEGLNKDDEASELSDSGSLPPPPAEMEPDHRLNSAQEMTTFSANK